MYPVIKWFIVKVIAIGLIASIINLYPVSFVLANVVDYDIVYVRMPRDGDNRIMNWTEVKNPVNVEPGGDLMLLHPDGSEELLYEGGIGAVADPFVSLDGKKGLF